MALSVLKPSTIKAALAAGVKKKLFDGGGLILRVTSATSASWVFKFTEGGVTDEASLGSFFKMSMIGDTIDLDPIREARDRCIRLVAEGRNPKQVLTAEKHDRRVQALAPRPMAIHELVKANIELIAKEALSQKQRDAWINSLRFERIGPIARMKPEEVTDLAAKVMMEAYYKKAPVMADDVRQRLYRVFVWANPPGALNPFRWEGHLEKCCKRKLTDDEEGHAALDHDRIGEFVAKLRGENERVTNALALEWAILSGSRANEACGADWSEIKWGDDECWVIPARRMKMRREHVVPLTDRHFEILARMKPPTHMGPEYPASGPIFPGRKAGKGVSVTGLRKFMQSIKDTNGVRYIDPIQQQPITLHGFRSTFRTWAEEQMLPDGSDHRYSEKLLETCLAHAVGSTTRRKYVRVSKAQVEVRRNIMATWASYCGVVQSAKVVPLRQRRAA